MSRRHEKYEYFEETCPTNACEEVKVTVPVTVHAFADVDDVEIKCIGSPSIVRNSHETPGMPGAVSRFTVSQRLRVEIPMSFGAKADMGEAHVDFTPCESKSKCE